MKVINKIEDIKLIVGNLKSAGKIIAVVPTMGYLHDGHLSLVRKAKELGDIVISTLFVNPKQFGPKEDFERYPRNEESDIKKLADVGCDFLFAPSVIEMYPEDFSTSISVGGITKLLEGITRPTHYDGVALVVLKLFNITLANIVVLGQKDYQQFMVISKLVKDLNLDIQLYMSPIIREESGLAMSSRNRYLSEDEHNQAAILYASLETAKQAILSGELNRNKINSLITNKLLTSPLLKIDYVETVIDGTFEIKDKFTTGDKIVILIACWLGKTRLIDNTILKIQ